MSVFLTETTSFQPQALLVADVPVFTAAVENTLRQAGFAVNVWPSAAQDSPTADFQIYDKIVVILIGPWRGRVGELVRWLLPVQDKVTLVLPAAPLVQGEGKGAQLAAKATRYLTELTSYLQNTLPLAKLCLLQDLVIMADCAYAVDEWWQYTLAPQTKEILFAADGTFYPQTAEQVGAALARLVLAPPTTPGEIHLVHGKALSQKEVAHHLQQAVQSRWQQIYAPREWAKCTPVAETHALVGREIEVRRTAGMSLADFVHEVLIRRFAEIEIAPEPTVSSSAAPFASLSNSASPAVVTTPVVQHTLVCPLVIPQIPNRMKSYELHQSALRNQQRLAPLQQRNASQLLKHRTPVGPPQPKPLTKTPQERALEAEIARIFDADRVHQKVVQTKIMVKKKQQTKRKTRARTAVFSVAATVLGCVLGLGIMGGSFFVLRQAAQQQVFTIAQAFTKNAPDSVGVPNAHELTRLKQLSSVFSFEVQVYKTIFGPDQFAQDDLLLGVAQQLPTVLTQHAQLHQDVSQVFAHLTANDPGPMTTQLTQLSTDLDQSYQALSVLQNKVQSYQGSAPNDQYAQVLGDFGRQMQDQRKIMASATQLQSILPGFLGMNGRKTYAVLLQNNQELRPTGGFLQAVALVTFDQGNIADVQVLDVEELDKNFAGQVAPPPEVQSYLGAHSWLLRDANWDPDFNQTSNQVTWFLQRMVGKQVDGVIGLNLVGLQTLLEQTGPVQVPEFNEKITAKNLADRVLFHSELQLVNTGKPAYLPTLFNHVLTALTTVPQAGVEPLLGALFTTVKNGQTTLFLADQNQAAVIHSLGWGGEVASPQCPSPLNDQACVTDGFFQVEANIGANKANATVTRQIAQNVDIQDNQIVLHRTMTFTNTAATNAWPLGAYKAYLRFYVPANASLQELRVNNVLLPNGVVATQLAHDRKYFGTSVEVAVGQTKTIDLTYSEPLTQAKPFSYVFFEQKQPGTDDDPYTLTVHYPASLHPAVIAPEAKVDGQTITFSMPRSKSLFMGVKFN